jgi:hypothetical protein
MTATGRTAVNKIVLQNDYWELTVLPDVGAKVYDLVWRASGKNYLWHNPRIQPQQYPVDANFDNYWCGGWDDIFPTADSCEFKGEVYPICGELRSLQWALDSITSTEVSLSAYGPISPIHATKTIRLSSAIASMHYRIENLGPGRLTFLWGTHPALAVAKGDTLRIPAGRGLVSSSSAPSMGTPGQEYRWPQLGYPGGVTDMSKVQPISACVNCGHYVIDLTEGWFGVEAVDGKSGIVFQFPLEQCPYLWMWIVYGGWRGYHHVIIEPWTSYPVHLADAVRAQRNRELEPGGIFDVTVMTTAYCAPETAEEALARLKNHAIK